MHKEIGKGTNILMGENNDFVNKEGNYYNSAKLDYYKPNTFNQSENLSNAYHIQDLEEYKC